MDSDYDILGFILEERERDEAAAFLREQTTSFGLRSILASLSRCCGRFLRRRVSSSDICHPFYKYLPPIPEENNAEPKLDFYQIEKIRETAKISSEMKKLIENEPLDQVQELQAYSEDASIEQTLNNLPIIDFTDDWKTSIFQKYVEFLVGDMGLKIFQSISPLIWIFLPHANIILITENEHSWSVRGMYSKWLIQTGLDDCKRIGHPYYWDHTYCRKMNRMTRNLRGMFKTIDAMKGQTLKRESTKHTLKNKKHSSLSSQPARSLAKKDPENAECPPIEQPSILDEQLIITTCQMLINEVKSQGDFSAPNARFS